MQHLAEFRPAGADPRLKRWHAAVAAAAFFGFVLWVGGLLVHNHVQDERASRQAVALAQASNIRARIESQLNSVLFLSSGLSSYLVVRNKTMQDEEIRDILRTMHGSNPLVRNFGIAVGYRLRYVYPLAGNESVVGLYYPDQKAQWPMIERIVREGKPALDGPLTLVQGGRGLIYRVPISVGDRYWGLLSTVINADAIFKAALDGVHDEQVTFAVRQAEGSGAADTAVWGDQGVFDQPGAVLQRVEVPGGAWTLAAVHTDSDAPARFVVLAWLAALLAGGLGGWAIHSIILNRIRLAELALYDRLTGLPNRNLLHEQALRAFARRDRHPQRDCVLLFIDLDGFKAINDLYGHRAGDATLREAARRAARTLRAADMMARWGGDEFIVLLEGLSPAGVASLTARLREAIETPLEHEGRTLRVGASIGVARYPDAGRDLDEIVKAADHLMYLDKCARKRLP